MRGFTLMVIALGTLLVGCGSSEPAPLDKAAFVKKAEFLCQKGMQRRGEAMTAATEEFEASEENVTPKIQEEAVLKVMQPNQVLLNKLKSLKVSSDQQQKVRAFISSIETALSRVEEKPLIAIHGNPFGKAEQLASAFGLHSCKF